MVKKNLHPIYYKTKIYCNNELILELNTIKESLNVDIWSGNHPLYIKSKTILDVEGK
jgi:ribosomal protein L31